LVENNAKIGQLKQPKPKSKPIKIGSEQSLISLIVVDKTKN